MQITKNINVFYSFCIYECSSDAGDKLGHLSFWWGLLRQKYMIANILVFQGKNLVFFINDKSHFNNSWFLGLSPLLFGAIFSLLFSKWDAIFEILCCMVFDITVFSTSFSLSFYTPRSLFSHTHIYICVSECVCTEVSFSFSLFLSLSLPHCHSQLSPRLFLRLIHLPSLLKHSL